MRIEQIEYSLNKRLAYKSLGEYYAKQLGVEDVPLEEPKDSESISLVYLKDDEEVIGRLYGMVDYTNYSIRIEGLFVDEKARGTGAGRSLMLEVEKIAKEKGCMMAFVDTTTSSAPKFYEKQGYSLIGQIKDYPVENETYFLYKKRLDVK